MEKFSLKRYRKLFYRQKMFDIITVFYALSVPFRLPVLRKVTAKVPQVIPAPVFPVFVDEQSPTTSDAPVTNANHSLNERTMSDVEMETQPENGENLEISSYMEMETRPENREGLENSSYVAMETQPETTEDLESSSSELHYDAEMIQQMASSLGISSRECLWMLFVNNGSPLKAVEWLTENIGKCDDDQSPLFDPDLDAALTGEMREDLFKAKNLRKLYGEESLRNRSEFLLADHKELLDELKKSGKSFKEFLENLYEQRFNPGLLE